MHYKPSLTNAVFALIIASLVLPIAVCLILGLAALLTAMGDLAGGGVLRYVALAGGVLWCVVLVGLILVQAISSLGRPDEPDE